MSNQSAIEHLINHIFFPPKLPQGSDSSPQLEQLLAQTVLQHATSFAPNVPESQKRVWDIVLKMLGTFNQTLEAGTEAMNATDTKILIKGQKVGEVLVLHIRAHNAALILRKDVDCTRFESFEVTPPNQEIMQTAGKLLCTFPGPSISVPDQYAFGASFCEELASVLCQLDVDPVDASATTEKAQSTVEEHKDSPSPHYITEWLTNTLCGLGGTVVEPTRITKRIANEVLWDNAPLPWTRSPTWLVLRVALQTTIEKGTSGKELYKNFLLFFMTKILDKANDAAQVTVPDDMLFCMRAKIGRRLNKLFEVVDPFVSTYAKTVLESSGDGLRSRWKETQEEHSKSPAWRPELLDPARDIAATFSSSRPYIMERFGASSTPRPPITLALPTLQRVQASGWTSDAILPAIESGTYTAVADFEWLVHHEAGTWSREIPDICEVLGKLIQAYLVVARLLYAGSPENQSIMALTAYYLWMMLDQACVARCPLLEDFGPEVPVELFEPLLLKQRIHLQNLQFIEDHVRRRHRRALTSSLSIFSDIQDSRSFAVQYFMQDLLLQQQKRDIEAAAKAAKERKRQELIRLKTQYREHKDAAKLLDHEYYTNWRGWQSHSSQCEKCMLGKKAEDLMIARHEWPLPAQHHLGAAVVFELSAPVVFRIWREVTFILLTDVSRSTSLKAASHEMSLKGYVGIQPHLKLFTVPMAESWRSVSYASTTKSFYTTGYQIAVHSASVDNICVNNGLTYRLFDFASGCWATDFSEGCSLAHVSRIRLPADSQFHKSEDMVNTVTHTVNEVVAAQDECLEGLNVHDFIAFRMLRSGGNLQWLNILRDARSCALLWNDPAAYLLLLAASNQVGPAANESSSVRPWHQQLHEERYSLTLFNEMKKLLSSVEGNWRNLITVNAVIQLVTTLLATTTHAAVSSIALGLLARARRITYTWLCTLAERLHSNSKSQSDVPSIQHHILLIAATCRSTFDVEEALIETLLEGDGNVGILIECSILVQERTPPSGTHSSFPSHVSILLDRGRRLSHELESIACQLVLQHQDELDLGLAAVLPGYSTQLRGEYAWSSMPSPHANWITTKYLDGVRLTEIHLDLLSGKLLVDGAPVNCLPGEICNHPTYRRIFGNDNLDVFPVSGDGYVCRHLVHGQKVSFSLLSGGGLIIRATDQSGSPGYELIPSAKFLDDVPSFLVDEYSHWMQLSPTSTDSRSPLPTVGGAVVIQFRRLGDSWSTQSSHHHLLKLHVDMNDQSRMFHASPIKSRPVFLVDRRSATFKEITRQLAGLDTGDNVLITYDSEASTSIAELYRYRLKFIVREGLLHSADYIDMVIDTNQSPGCFIGLTDRLLLRPVCELEHVLPRRLVLPFKPASIDAQMGDDGRTVTRVDTAHLSRVQYMSYEIDEVLGRLQGVPTLASTLYAVLLHATTSSCWADPLTGQTGTEQALAQLGSARCISFQELCQEDITLLEHIALLSSRRDYYPPHIQAMQQVHWRSISALSQHPTFCSTVLEIIEHALSMIVFQEDRAEGTYADRLRKLKKSITPAPILHARAAMRCSYYYPADPSIQPPEDAVYLPRQHSTSPKNATAAQRMAASIVQLLPVPEQPTDLLAALISWDTLSGTKHGEAASISFTPEWFNPQLSSIFLPVFREYCQGNITNIRFRILFPLCAMTYGPGKDRKIASTLLAAAIHGDRSWDVSFPTLRYNLAQGFCPNDSALEGTIAEHNTTFDTWLDHRQHLQRYQHSKASFREAQALVFRETFTRETKQLLDYVDAQWMAESYDLRLRTLGLTSVSVVDLQTSVQSLVDSWNCNCQLKHKITTIEHRLTRAPSAGYPSSAHQMCTIPPAFQTSSKHSPRPGPLFVHPMLSSILSSTDAESDYTSELSYSVHLDDYSTQQQASNLLQTNPLEQIISELRGSTSSPFAKLYGASLEESLKALQSTQSSPLHVLQWCPEIQHLFEAHRCYCRVRVTQRMSAIHRELVSTRPSLSVLEECGILPSMAPLPLLGLLAHESTSNSLPFSWRRKLVLLALDLLQVQRSQRLLHLLHQQRSQEILKELQNRVMELEFALDHTGWLLIQVDGNFAVRDIQREVAQFMTDRTREMNSVLQLNMGEGKTSVIAPLVAAELSDGQTLVRVVTLKPLAPQMFQNLVQRLTGLADRPVFVFPFSRRIIMDPTKCELFQQLFSMCIAKQGILVAQPEHLLSFKLMCVDTHLRMPESQAARSLVDCQQWLDSVTRDIFDESDELLHVKYQLVYSSGTQILPDGHPDRWIIAQQLLELVHTHAMNEVGSKHPHGLETENTSKWAFPSIRILDNEAARHLIDLVIEDVLCGSLPQLPVKHLTPSDRNTIRTFITNTQPPPSEALDRSMASLRVSELWKPLLLLRGLLAHGILLYVFTEKRWRVDYGLFPSRTTLAVPFTAKDQPSPRADFAHPDVSILLTCLSYYYQGLDNEQLRSAFTALLKQENADVEYGHWCTNLSLQPCNPDKSLRSLSNINLDDPAQSRGLLHRYFSRNKATIDFYLNQLVFPLAAKHFTHKLSTSAWDLAAQKDHTTVGFSGTNDNQYLLPTTIQQCDPVQQTSLNAKVLSYLLLPENNQYAELSVARSTPHPLFNQLNVNPEYPGPAQPAAVNSPLSSREILDLIFQQERPVRVLLDVGAQLMDMLNVEVASTWLHMMEADKAAGVVFFTERDDLVILDREGRVVPFVTSPLSQQLHHCLVYLDESHTRGTDLKLPRDYRAAVTLGPKVTKDRLLQACMRMRQLGAGQSVIFLAPPEIHRAITGAMLTAGETEINVGSIDVIRWCILETIRSIEHHLPQWFQQGLSYDKRDNSWQQLLTPPPSHEAGSKSLTSVWLEHDSQSLEELYGDSVQPESSNPHNSPHGLLEHMYICGVAVESTQALEEEQEREISHEMEHEREVERRRPAPRQNTVHPHVLELVRTGRLNFPSDAFQPVFREQECNILQTTDFARTLADEVASALWQGPVHWVLSCRRETKVQHILLLSAFEADHLLGDIRTSSFVHLHVYFPRVTKFADPVDDLRFHVIPPLPSSWSPPSPSTILQLNLCAGQLFMSSFKDYEHLATLLGLYTPRIMGLDGIPVIQPDGFIAPEHRIGDMKTLCRYMKSPLVWLKGHLSQRRKGTDFSATHLGRITRGRHLEEKDDF